MEILKQHREANRKEVWICFPLAWRADEVNPEDSGSNGMSTTGASKMTQNHSHYLRCRADHHSSLSSSSRSHQENRSANSFFQHPARRGLGIFAYAAHYLWAKHSRQGKIDALATSTTLRPRQLDFEGALDTLKLQVKH